MTSSAAPTRCLGLALEAAEVRAGVDELRKDGCRNPEALGEFEVPLAGADVDEAGRRRVRALGDPGPGEQERDEVGDEKRDVRLGQRLLGDVLVQRVERQVLESVPAVELLERDDRVHRVGAAQRALVPVVEGLGRRAVRRATSP